MKIENYKLTFVGPANVEVFTMSGDTLIQPRIGEFALFDKIKYLITEVAHAPRVETADRWNYILYEVIVRLHKVS